MGPETAASSGFTISIQKEGFARYKLKASQVMPIPKERAFQFFEDPHNLSHIIPDWLHFHFESNGKDMLVQNNAEFSYTLKWLGIPLRWRSRITDYEPPHRFTDIQLQGPYVSWVHTHILEEVPGGTRMRDEVSYAIPLIAVPIHGLIIRGQLNAIFRYRAQKVSEWAHARSG